MINDKTGRIIMHAAIIFMFIFSAETLFCENLLVNPGFEEEIDASEWRWLYRDDAPRRGYRTTEQSRSGGWSYVIENDVSVLTPVRGKAFPVNPGDIVEFSGWIKTELEGEDSAAFFRLLFYNIEDESVAQRRSSPQVSGISGWTHQNITWVAPDEAAYFRPNMDIYRGTGKAYFDDLDLRIRPGFGGEVEIPAVAVFTDLPEDSPMLENVKLLFGKGFVGVKEDNLRETLELCSKALVLYGKEQLPPETAASLKSFAYSGNTVFMDIRNFARFIGREAESIEIAPPSEWRWLYSVDAPRRGHRTTEQSRSGEWSYVIENDVSVLTPVRGKAYPVNPGDIVEYSGWIKTELEGEPGSAGIRLFFFTGEDERIAGRSSPRVSGRSDWTRVTAVLEAPENAAYCSPNMDIYSGTGKAYFDDMSLRILSGEEADAKDGGNLIRNPGFEIGEGGHEIVLETSATSGFKKGDIFPRMDEDGMLCVLPGEVADEGIEALAVVAGSAEISFAKKQLGKGYIYGIDMFSVGEPNASRESDGSFYKYLFMTNTLTNTVRYGEWYQAPEREGASTRYTHADIADEMRKIADSFPGVEFEKEGPGSGGYEIYSLNIGKEGAPLYFFYAAAHGEEWDPAYGLLTFTRRLAAGEFRDVVDLDRAAFKIIPVLNPWGYDNFRRTNANNVDLNRQGDYRWEEFGMNQKGYDETHPSYWKGHHGPFSEPETIVYSRIIDENEDRIYFVLDFHGNKSAVNNKLCMLPVNGLPDNQSRAILWAHHLNENVRGRYILQQSGESKASPYLMRMPVMSSPGPMLINTSAKDRYGFVIELTAAYRTNIASILVTDFVCEIIRSILVVYPVPTMDVNG